METVFDHVSRALMALDLSEEDAELAKLEEQIVETAAAIDKAQQRRAEIDREKRSLHDANGRPSGRAVADALLRGADTSVAASLAPDLERLDRERLALSAAIGDLDRRTSELHSAIVSVRTRATQQVIRTVEPAVEHLMTTMRSAAQDLVTGYAALSAIGQASGGGFAHQRQQASNVMTGITGQGGLISWRKTVAVPSEVLEMLAGLEAKGRSLPVTVPDTVAMP